MGSVHELYEQVCPVLNEIRYVGITQCGSAERLRQHLKEKEERPKNAWLRALSARGLAPFLRVTLRLECNRCVGSCDASCPTRRRVKAAESKKIVELDARDRAERDLHEPFLLNSCRPGHPNWKYQGYYPSRPPAPYTLRMMLDGAEVVRRITGKPPHKRSGSLGLPAAHSWMNAFTWIRVNGHNPARLFGAHRGVWSRKLIVKMARTHYERHGRWPTPRSGVIVGDGRKWAAAYSWCLINLGYGFERLFAPARFFPRDMSLAQIRRVLRTVCARAGRPSSHTKNMKGYPGLTGQGLDVRLKSLGSSLRQECDAIAPRAQLWSWKRFRRELPRIRALWPLERFTSEDYVSLAREGLLPVGCPRAPHAVYSKQWSQVLGA